jgi:hypothetical protein
VARQEHEHDYDYEHGHEQEQEQEQEHDYEHEYAGNGREFGTVTGWSRVPMRPLSGLARETRMTGDGTCLIFCTSGLFGSETCPKVLAAVDTPP